MPTTITSFYQRLAPSVLTIIAGAITYHVGPIMQQVRQVLVQKESLVPPVLEEPVSHIVYHPTRSSFPSHFIPTPTIPSNNGEPDKGPAIMIMGVIGLLQMVFIFGLLLNRPVLLEKDGNQREPGSDNNDHGSLPTNTRRAFPRFNILSIFPHFAEIRKWIIIAVISLIFIHFCPGKQEYLNDEVLMFISHLYNRLSATKEVHVEVPDPNTVFQRVIIALRNQVDGCMHMVSFDMPIPRGMKLQERRQRKKEWKGKKGRRYMEWYTNLILYKPEQFQKIWDTALVDPFQGARPKNIIGGSNAPWAVCGIHFSNDVTSLPKNPLNKAEVVPMAREFGHIFTEANVSLARQLYGWSLIKACNLISYFDMEPYLEDFNPAHLEPEYDEEEECERYIEEWRSNVVPFQHDLSLEQRREDLHERKVALAHRIGRFLDRIAEVEAGK